MSLALDQRCQQIGVSVACIDADGDAHLLEYYASASTSALSSAIIRDGYNSNPDYVLTEVLVTAPLSLSALKDDTDAVPLLQRGYTILPDNVDGSSVRVPSQQTIPSSRTLVTVKVRKSAS